MRKFVRNLKNLRKNIVFLRRGFLIDWSILHMKKMAPCWDRNSARIRESILAEVLPPEDFVRIQIDSCKVSRIHCENPIRFSQLEQISTPALTVLCQLSKHHVYENPDFPFSERTSL